MDTKSLSINANNLKILTVNDRLKQLGMEEVDAETLSALTPTELALLFPGYLSWDIPSISGATSGATKLTSSGGIDPSSAIPIEGHNAPSHESLREQDRASAEAIGKLQKEQKKKEQEQRRLELKERVKVEAEKRRQKSQQKRTDYKKISEKISVDKKGYVNKQQLFNAAVKKFSKSPLNGYVPKDGEKYGIDGTPESWAKFSMRIISSESGFRTGTTMPSDPGGSYGLFQFGFHYGINRQNWRDPNAQLDAFVTYTNDWVIKDSGYILPPKGEAKRKWAGYGGFGAHFSTTRNGTHEKRYHQNIADKLYQNFQSTYQSEQAIKDASSVDSPTEEQKRAVDSYAPESIYPDGHKPGKRLEKLPNGVTPEVQKYFDNLTKDEQSQFLTDIYDVAPETINQWHEEGKAKRGYKTGEIQTGHPEDQWGVEPGKTTKGVNTKLISSMEAAAKDFPLRVRLFSGKMDRSGGDHGKGRAADVAIFDENGYPLSGYQDPQTSNFYAMYWQKVYEHAERLHGKKFADNISWLGADVRADGTYPKALGEKHSAKYYKDAYGSMDLMDFRLKPTRFKADEAFVIGKGWSSKYGKAYTEGDFLGIGPIKGKFTDEHYKMLEGFTVTDEQKKAMIQRNKDVRSHAGLFNRLKNFNGGIGPRKHPLEQQVAQTEETATTLAEEEKKSLDAYASLNLYEGWENEQTPTASIRKKMRKEGKVIVNADTNWAPKSVGGKTDPLIVIPDDADDNLRAAAQNYVDNLASVYEKHLGRKVTGVVKTRSQNIDAKTGKPRGRLNTVHLEPFAVTDNEASKFFTQTEEGRAAYAKIVSDFGAEYPEAIFSLPHKPKPGGRGDRGAKGKYGNEVDFASTLLSDMEAIRMEAIREASRTAIEEASRVEAPTAEQQSIVNDLAPKPIYPDGPTPGKASPVEDYQKNLQTPGSISPAVKDVYTPSPMGIQALEQQKNLKTRAPDKTPSDKSSQIKDDRETIRLENEKQTEPVEETLGPIEIEQDAPEFKAGGELSGEDMALIHKRTGKVRAHLNSGERVQVIPKNRTSDEDIRSRTRSERAHTEMITQSREEKTEGKRKPVQTENASSKIAMRDNAERLTEKYSEISQSSQNPYKTASNQRAMARTRFMETGDPIKGHFSSFAANMKLA